MTALATLTYRLASYWLPLPIGLFAWLLHHRRYGEEASWSGATGRTGPRVSERG